MHNKIESKAMKHYVGAVVSVVAGCANVYHRFERRVRLNLFNENVG